MAHSEAVDVYDGLISYTADHERLSKSCRSVQVFFAETPLFGRMFETSVDSCGQMRKIERPALATFALQPATELETAEIVRSSSLQLVAGSHQS